MPTFWLMLSWGSGHPPATGEKAPNPMILTTGWGSPEASRAEEKAPTEPVPNAVKEPVPNAVKEPVPNAVKEPVPNAVKGTIPMPDDPEKTRYLTDRLTAIADTACNYREYHTMQIPDRFKLGAMHDGLDTVAKRLRELIIELSGSDPWQHHPPGAAP